LEILPPLLGGLNVFLADELQQKEPRLLIAGIVKQQVHMIQVTPSRLKLLLSSDNQLTCLKGVAVLMVGGENFPAALFSEVQKKFPGKLYNLYGPTETTVWSTVKELTGNCGVSIGRPIANTQIYITDSRCRLQPVGVAGEMSIGGAGVARGYLNRPELTSDRFYRYYRSNRAYILYKTGDLGRWQPDGNIEFLGRLDTQVKIRGFRIELAEIEKQLMRHRDIKEAVVVLRDDDSGDKYICAYILTNDSGPERESQVPSVFKSTGLREYLAEILPDYMIPSYFIFLDEMPLTPNLKIDRRALPVPGITEIGGRKKYLAPRDEFEEKLMGLWIDVLFGTNYRTISQPDKVIGIDDNFFELGGHSLKATVLASRIHSEFNIILPLSGLFKHPRIRELSGYLKKLKINQHEPMALTEDKDYYDLSQAQKRLYFMYCLDVKSINYNMPNAVLLEGEPDKERLEQCLKKLIQRHESLRTFFVIVDGEGVQRICKVFPGKILEIYDAEVPGTPDNLAGGAHVIMKKFIRPFDLSHAPLLRVGLIKQAEGKYILMIDLHHIICDGISQGLFIKDLNRLFEGKDRDLPELKRRYRDFSEWQNHEKKRGSFIAQENFWLKRFEGEIPVLNFPLDFPRSSLMKFEGATIFCELEKDLSQRLTARVKETHATFYIFLLTVYVVLLFKYTQQEDIIVGSPVSGRHRVDLQDIIGMFVNMLSMRNFPAAHKTFDEFLEEVKINAVETFENQDYQFNELVIKLGLQGKFSKNPLFNVVFSAQDDGIDLRDLTGPVGVDGDHLKVTPHPLEFNISQFDLIVGFSQIGEKIKIAFTYALALFEPSTAEKILDNFINILWQVMDDHYIKLCDITISRGILTSTESFANEELEEFEF
jgi:NRPS condensation-like uncharacterized protein/acyl carrier protein